MTNVLSYRTDKVSELKILAKERNISLSQISSDIVDNYLESNRLFSGMNLYCDIREIISICFESIDEKQLEKVLNVSMKDVAKAMKLKGINSFEKASEIAIGFFNVNSFSLEKHDTGSHLVFVSKNPMPKNWNIYVSTIITLLFKNVGYCGIVESVDHGFFSVAISKELQL